MCNEEKFYICKHCGNFIRKVKDSGVSVVCCGENMKELIANTTDAATEKHVPDVTIEGDKVSVQVGSVLHPMLEEHHIEWIYVKTNQGAQMKCLEIGKDPVASFALAQGESVVEVYEYCNLHGLWKKEI
jgi:superoxide reductase